MSAGKARGLNILMLHGFTQSGTLFHAKTRALEKAITKAFPSPTLHYATGPVLLSAADVPGYSPSANADAAEMDAYGWWRRKDETPPISYHGLEQGLQRIADAIRSEGPFDGVVGFSQGACAAAMVASLLEPGRREAFRAARAADGQKLAYPASFVTAGGEAIQPPMKFAVVYSGFAAPVGLYSAFYEPAIGTPTLHVLGSVDTVVSRERSGALIDCCRGGSGHVVVHPGGHFVPSQKAYLDAVTGFINACLHETLVPDKREESVEDMDMPF